ncbi:MAG TPA: PIN domain-containing protein [Candidatus Binatia bacterium]|nr:PIN domain-containing protein [Candidatus Binatia bacterium]
MPTAFLPDTSCMIAAVCSWHEHHEAAAAEIERRLAGRAKMVVAAPALVEAYAVLTRLPAPHRLSPETALTLLQNNFLKLATTIALDAKSYRALLLEVPKRNLAGGRTYDAVIGACAGQGKASTVLTFNAGHFTGLGYDFDVVIPRTT